MLSRFHLIPERYGWTDRQTDRFAISISRVSMLTRDNYSQHTIRISVRSIMLFLRHILIIETFKIA